MIRRRPSPTRLTHSFPTRRSADLIADHPARDQRLADRMGIGVAKADMAPARGRVARADASQPDRVARRREHVEQGGAVGLEPGDVRLEREIDRSAEHTSEIQHLMRSQSDAFHLNKQNTYK